MDRFVGEPNYELIKKAAAKLLKEGRKTDEISTRAPRVESDALAVEAHGLLYHISIHAPHAGSDSRARDEVQRQRISIHAPHAGSDLSCLRG